MLWMQTELDSDWMYVSAAETRVWNEIIRTDFNHKCYLKSENLESSSEDKTTSKIAITCQSKVSLQSPANES